MHIDANLNLELYIFLWHETPLFSIGAQLIKNLVIASGGQKRTQPHIQNGVSLTHSSSHVTLFLVMVLSYQGLKQAGISLLAQMVNASAYNWRDPGSIPGSGRSPKEGNGNPLQYSYLENPMDRGVWQVTVHGVAKSQTQLSYFTFTFKLGRQISMTKLASELNIVKEELQQIGKIELCIECLGYNNNSDQG